MATIARGEGRPQYFCAKSSEIWGRKSHVSVEGGEGVEVSDEQDHMTVAVLSCYASHVTSPQMITMARTRAAMISKA